MQILPLNGSKPNYLKRQRDMIKTELFNTHQFVKDLKAAGMDEKQAEVLAENQLAMLDTHIATKADVLDLKRDIAEFKAESKKDTEWMKRLLLGIGIAVGFAAVKYVFS